MGAETRAILAPAGSQHVYSAGKIKTFSPGKQSTQVDIGSSVNIIGINAAREFDQQSRQH
eukprot:8373446-Pyramimonas_sp.AAC.1